MELKNKLESLSVDSRYITEKMSLTRKDSFLLDGLHMLKREAALHEIYVKLGFNQYIKYANYDGLEELLAPASWEEDREYLSIIIKNADAFIMKADEDLVAMLFKMFKYTGEEWDKKNLKSFSVLLES